jgi:hypothetical protein
MSRADTRLGAVALRSRGCGATWSFTPNKTGGVQRRGNKQQQVVINDGVERGSSKTHGADYKGA